ncbi:MlaD family protein [Fontisphaera persica]|uniref:MlaD family protein n=1 Tax=Fontisphaera persica TaxID=2974023 RepID=UPI0024C0CC97|nr:MlaD family protein [Fontisphaera persica]WCJ60435.1 MlaD family protein [Fontisphaera persica]
MSEKSLTTRVGIFVLVGLVALAILLLNFSKSGDWFEDTYILYLRTPNVSGIKQRAAVLMAGVPVGYVHKIELTADGRSVILTARIYSKYLIRRDAVFAIEQSGFLGDQYVAIAPRSTQGGFLQNGDVVKCLPPFDLQDTARRASDLLDSVGATLTDVRSAFSNVNGTLLSQQSLTNYATNLVRMLENVRMASESVQQKVPEIMTNAAVLAERARRVAEEVESLVQTHTAAVSHAILDLRAASSNVQLTTASLRRTGESLEDWMNTNRPRLDNVVKNIENASQSVTNIITGVQADLDAGRGLLGGLLRDETMKSNTAVTLEHASLLSSNLNVAAGNLNRYGLWWMLWKPKYPKTNTAASVKSPAGRAK